MPTSPPSTCKPTKECPWLQPPSLSSSHPPDHRPSALIPSRPGTGQLGTAPVSQIPLKSFMLASPKPAHTAYASIPWKPQWTLSPELSTCPSGSWCFPVNPQGRRVPPPLPGNCKQYYLFSGSCLLICCPHHT